MSTAYASSTTTFSAGRFGRRLPPFSLLAVAGLLGVSATYLYIGLFIDSMSQVLPIIVVPAVLAGLVETRWRWATIPPVLAVAFASIFEVPMAANFHRYNVEHGQDFAIGMMVLPALYTLILVASVVATWQNYRRPVERRTAPAWLRPAMLVFVGVVAGGAALGFAIPEHGVVARVNDNALADLPSITAADEAWMQTEVHVKAGEVFAYRIDNADNQVHTFDVDAFDIHAPLAAGESALVMFKATAPGRYAFHCAIPGHDMNGVIVVDQ
jgi:uncharacterized cupredoxin-like copper-binding protein